jgi:hypothetical protein
LTELIGHLESQYREIFISVEFNSRKKETTFLLDVIFPLIEKIAPGGCKFSFHPGDPGRLGFFAKPTTDMDIAITEVYK